jgi:low affinity Fe/Cu permease
MVSELFNRFTRRSALAAGRPVTLALAFAAVIIWAAIGPFAGYSDVWQLTINTATTIVTFLMVFIIQNSQNRDSLAIQIKLNELLRAQTTAQNTLFDLEELSEEELERIQKRYEALSAKLRGHRMASHGVPAIDMRDSPEGLNDLEQIEQDDDGDGNADEPKKDAAHVRSSRKRSATQRDLARLVPSRREPAHAAGVPRGIVTAQETSMPAKSKAQQKAAGAALSAKRGETAMKNLKGASREMAKSMTEKQLEDLAETKRSRLPQRKTTG